MSAVPAPVPRAATSTTPVIALHLAPKDQLMATDRRRVRTITTQHHEEPIAIAPGSAIRAADVAQLITEVGEEARATDNATEPWIRLDAQTNELTVGYTTETRS